jgi:hypothetical protein
MEESHNKLFDSLDVNISEIVNSYSKERQKEIVEYLSELDDHQKKAYRIAFGHLGSSFNVLRSNGFQDWKSKKQTK